MSPTTNDPSPSSQLLREGSRVDVQIVSGRDRIRVIGEVVERMDQPVPALFIIDEAMPGNALTMVCLGPGVVIAAAPPRHPGL